MPTLNRIGKDKVINHHQEVPFRVPDHQYGSIPDGKQEATVNTGNLIIHGDNLEKQYFVYADNGLLLKAFQQNNNIIFKKIPRDISHL